MTASLRTHRAESQPRHRSRDAQGTQWHGCDPCPPPHHWQLLRRIISTLGHNPTSEPQVVCSSFPVDSWNTRQDSQSQLLTLQVEQNCHPSGSHIFLKKFCFPPAATSWRFLIHTDTHALVSEVSLPSHTKGRVHQRKKRNVRSEDRVLIFCVLKELGHHLAFYIHTTFNIYKSWKKNLIAVS